MGKKEVSGNKQEPAIKVKPKLKPESNKSSVDDYKSQKYNTAAIDNTAVVKPRPVPLYQRKLKFNPVSKSQNNGFPRIDNTYVYQPNRSLVGTGGLKLKLKSGPPEFKGYIIFVNGFWGDPIKNTGAVAWNSIMDKVPERHDPYSLKGAENVDENDQSSADDRYTPEEYNKDVATSKSTLRKVGSTVRNVVYPLPSFIYWQLHATKMQRFVKYWNVKENGYRFTTEYAKYFNAEGNVHYLNGSHGLESNPGHRMDHGRKQGLTWAKLNLHYMTKDTYDTFKDFIPGLASPEYNPITIVMHSQGNAFGVGVANGILEYLRSLKWDKAAINMVHLAMHQNVGYVGKEFDQYVDKKIDMMADRTLKARAAEFFNKERAKLKLPKGIDEYAAEKLGKSSWVKLKSRAVQFTFPNDRSDVVSRMGDIKGIANACSRDGDDLNFTPFELVNGSYKIYSKYILNKLWVYDSLDSNGEILINKKKTKLYTDLVRNYAKIYYEYKKLLEEIKTDPSKQYQVFVAYDEEKGENVTVKVDRIPIFKIGIVRAYGEIFEAELEAHSGPTKWGLNKQILEWSNGKSIFKLITEKGTNVFYNKSNKNTGLLINPLNMKG